MQQHIFIVTVGSRGDVQPFVAIGQRLVKEGYRVTLCASSTFESFVRDHGIEYAFLNDSLVDLINSDTAREVLDRKGGIVGTIRSIVILIQMASPLQRQMLDEIWTAAQTCEPDLILYHPKAYGGAMAAEKLSIPAVLGLLFPQYVPTADFPALGFPRLGIGSWYTLGTYRMMHRVSRHVIRRFMREWRADQGLAPTSAKTDMLHDQSGKPIPIIHAISSAIQPRPADWPDAAHISGYWFLDEDESWCPSEDLVRFLDAGDPPVCVGFGSMAGRDPEKKTRLVLQALELAGVRGILVTGWGGLKAVDLPDSVLVLESAPHGWLFPRTSAVVHHGGAGTTAAALRAGRPSVICPFIADQPYWGRTLHELGVASEPIPQKKLTAENLSSAIRLVISDDGVRTRAEKLGTLIRSEDGTGEAVTVLERVLDSWERFV